MKSILNAGPCANIHRILPLLGTAAGFLGLLMIMAGSAAHLI